MRTLKGLVCAAALAAGLASVSAQVYSLNVVGYYNINVPAGTYMLIANQLNTTNNSIDNLFPAPPDGFQVLKYDGGWSAWSWSAEETSWSGSVPHPTLNLGEGALVKCPTATTLTFVGEVLQGNADVAINNGVYQVRSSKIPQAGSITALGYTPDDGDQVLKYSGGWIGSSWSAEETTWTGGEQTFGVGEGIMFKKTASSTGAWVRTFTVN